MKDAKKSPSVKMNYIYNLVYQIFLIIVPIFVTPYVARVLGAEASGQYSFSNSIVNYFVPFAALGFGYYGQRLIAKYSDDKYRQSLTFWEIFILKGIFTLLTIIIYILLVFLNVYDAKYETLILIMSLNIFSVLFDIVYFYQGREDFKKIVLRNVIIKLVSIVLIFACVRTSEDLWLYTLIQSLTFVINNISLWFYLRKDLVKVRFSDLKFSKHIIPAMLLFLPTIATSVYASINKTMITMITHSDFENGNFEYAEKLVNMGVTILTSLGTIMISRNSKLISENDLSRVELNISKTCQFVFGIGLPIFLGLFCVSENFVPWYLGDEYTLTPTLLKYMSPLILIMGLSNALGVQYLIPTGQDKKYTFTITSGTLLNIALNFLFITYFGALGAVFSTLISQFYILILVTVFIRKRINFLYILKSSWKYFFASLIMFAVCFTEAYFLDSNILNTFLIVFTGICLYGILILLLKDTLFYPTFMKILFKMKSIFTGNKNN